MQKKKTKLPNFKTIDEMATFFDKHSPLDVDGFEEVDIKFVKAKGIPRRAPRLKGIIRKQRSRRSMS